MLPPKHVEEQLRAKNTKAVMLGKDAGAALVTDEAEDHEDILRAKEIREVRDGGAGQ